MACPETVLELVDRFKRNREAYTSGHYNETQLRREFIDPFFISLGWDVNNEKGYAESYKDVIHEDAIKVGGATKAPDYCFRIGGARKFFLEAKKPSVNLKDDIPAAFQLRRYAWSAKLPLSILTDFEEFAIYDCRAKPHKNDKASTARIMYLTCDKYPGEWDKIASIFSPESISKGSFDKYAQSRRKRGTAEVDAAFLKEIERWRKELAKNIALRNTLTRREINFAVQRTIDRIIFLRICEDRGIEQQNRLQGLLGAPRIYPRLLQIFYDADDRYNSGLFHFRAERDRASDPDDLTPSLEIDDKVLKEIIKNLYYPDSPYEFSVLPADILGQVYEQFLGKVIHLSAGGHRVKVEDKPEVKKAGGVYYTPTYIVDYIVKNTVGKLLEGKTPKQASKLRILDPACGSGSFLIGAYQCLLDYHLRWYSENEPEKHAKGRNPKVYQSGFQSPAVHRRGSRGDWRLTTSERKRILLNNIYGVDIDTQAVEVTKLSLLLKVLEGESGQTLENQLKLYHERALPDLSSNIKCGNSLISPDFYEGKTPDMFDEEERYRINAFDWKDEFPEIFKGRNPGFDAVIGNPPYSSKQSLETKKISVFFDCVEYKSDPYALFIEQGFRKLKRAGLLGFIVPVTWMTNFYYKKLRQLMIDTKSLYKTVLIHGLVFKGANVDTCLLFLDKESVILRRFEWSCGVPDNLDGTISFRDYDIIQKEPRYDITPEEDEDWLRIKTKADKSSVKLSTLAKISLGMKLKSNKKFVSDRQDHNHPDAIYFGKDISRYAYLKPSRFFDFSSAVIVGGTKKQKVHRTKPKIFIQAIRNLSLRRRIVASLEINGDCFVGTLNGLTLLTSDYDILYILGLINSSFLNTYFRKRFTTISLTAAFIGALPIRAISFSDPADKGHHDQMVELVDVMLKLHKDFAKAKTEHDKTLLQRQIDATDRQIDKLVYELYGLSEEEIKIVEGR